METSVPTADRFEERTSPVATKFRFAKDVGPDDWVALPRPFAAGEGVVKFTGHDYECVRDDLMYGDRETVACSLDGDNPFFTVPVEFLLTEDGKHPLCAYMKRKD